MRAIFPEGADGGHRHADSDGIEKARPPRRPRKTGTTRSEEHTSELQSQSNLVCRLLLEKKKKKIYSNTHIRQSTVYAYSTRLSYHSAQLARDSYLRILGGIAPHLGLPHTDCDTLPIDSR